jgi:F-type H+-transporting ATPase subunit a
MKSTSQGMTISFIHILVSLIFIFQTATAEPQERAHPPESAQFDTSAAASAYGEPAPEHGGAAKGGHDNIGAVILHHISDSHELELPFIGVVHLPRLELWGMDFSITKHVVMMMVAAVLLVSVLGFTVRRRRANEVPTGFAAAIEAVVEFIRNEIAIPNLGEKFGILFTPYLCTAFFFILTCNLLGLVPYAATATGNVSVTAALASLTFILTQAMAIKVNGLVGYLKHFTGGVHPAMWIIMIPVEFLGLFTKPFALCIRLYANMTAGHVVILSLIGLIFIFGKGGANPVAGYGVVPLTLAFSLFVNLLEILVAFIQAYIFTLLSALFIGFAAHPHHEEEGHEAQH